VIPGLTFAKTKKKKGIRRVSPERARLPGKGKVSTGEGPLGNPFRKAGLLVFHGVILFLLSLSSLPSPLRPGEAAGLAVLVASLHYLGGLFLVRFHREDLASLSRCFSAFGISAAVLALTRLALVLGWPSTAVPLSAATLLFTLVLSQRFSLGATGFLTLCVGLILYCGGRSLMPALGVLGAGAAVAALTVGRVRKRSTLIRAGFFIGLAQVIVGVGCFLFLEGVTRFTPDHFARLAWYLGQGILVGFLASGLLPVVEYVFGVTTDVSLLELSNQNEQPVLRKLLIEAPGTFHHSFIVGLLAEAAAERIGAHGLLCRVGAYFHDIGKMVKPQYYAENMGVGASLHDALSPEMSALVIASHPKDSLELADYYDLPPCVRPFMTEHHGTTKIEYFYQQALKRQAEKGGTVDEESFRYPGPKPSSKESAIVMLADAVEAAVRSLNNPTPSRIRTVVEDLTWKRLKDGQLDESPLTLKDIKEIEEAFIAVLIGIHHTRPAYPSSREENAS